MEMGVDLLGVFCQLAVGLSVMFIAYTFITEFGTASAEMRERQIQSGDSSLAELYISLSPQGFWAIRALAFIVLFFLGFVLAGPLLGVVFGLVGFAIPALLLRRLRGKRIKKIELQLVEGLELLGNSLKSGLTLPQATELLIREFPPPISQEFALVMAETRLGVEFTDALENMARRLNSTIVFILASGVSITKRCGGDLTVIFGNIANTIRERATIEGKLDAVTAQGRFQGLVLGLMPFALIILLYFVDRQHVITLFSYRLGIWAVTAVAIMVIMAQLWIKKLLAIDV